MRKRSFRRTGGSGEWEAQLGTELYGPEACSLPRPSGNVVFLFVFCIKILLFKQNKEIKLFITGLLLGMEEGQFVTYLTGFLCDEW